MVRRWTCRHYGECLDRAARTNAKKVCDGCERYALPDPVRVQDDPLADVTVKRDSAKMAREDVVMKEEKVQGGGTVSCRKCGANPAVVAKNGRVIPCKQCRSAAISAGRRKGKDVPHAKAQRREELSPSSIDVARLTRAVEIVNTISVLCTDRKHSEAVARMYEELTAANG